MIVNRNRFVFETGIFFVVLSLVKPIFYCGLSSLVNYLGLFVILCYSGIFSSIKKVNLTRFKNISIVMAFFSVGILCQSLSIQIKIYLLLSMLVLALIAMVPNSRIKTQYDFNQIKIAVASSLFISIIVSVLCGYDVYSHAVEGWWNFGFDAGMVNKNYFSYITISMFILEYIFYLRDKCINRIIWMICWGFLLLASNSRGAWLLFIIILLVMFFSKIRINMIKKAIKFLSFLSCIGIIVLIVENYESLMYASLTYAYRIRGVLNYIDYLGFDMFHLFFGNAELAFGDSDNSYATNIRSVIGWDGTVEVSYLNIIIKNGLIGLCGYFIIFKHYFKQIGCITNREVKIILYSYLWIFILSGFCEAFIADIKMPFSILSYLILCNVAAMDVHERT